MLTLLQWHATVSQADEQWTEQVFNQIFNGKPFDQVIRFWLRHTYTSINCIIVDYG